MRDMPDCTNESVDLRQASSCCWLHSQTDYHPNWLQQRVTIQTIFESSVGDCAEYFSCLTTMNDRHINELCAAPFVTVPLRFQVRVCTQGFVVAGCSQLCVWPSRPPPVLLVLWLVLALRSFST